MIAQNWTISSISLLPGVNNIVVTYTDPNNVTATDQIAVTYAPTFPGNAIVGAWAFDEPSGTTATDSSGAGNTGTYLNGATRAPGKFGTALSLDGNNDYVVVGDSNSLDFTQSFTFSAWVLPAAVHTDWRAVIVKNYMMALYASSNGICGAGTPLVWFQSNGTIGPGFYACYSTPLPINQWTHLAGTYDGTNLKLYQNGVLVVTTPATGYMEPSTLSLQIGASQFAENFEGLIDEARVRNYAVALTGGANTTFAAVCNYADSVALATASIIGDANCPIIQTAAITIKIPASATGLKVGSAATGLKFGK